MTGIYLCMALVVAGFGTVAYGCGASRPPLTFAGALLQAVGAVGVLVLTHG